MPEPRIACERLGLEYHALGMDVGHTVAHPEQELVTFDLVFASARAALEAMCCGCAVVACDGRGSAGLVTPQNFDELRAQNFGLRCLHQPVTTDYCAQEIGRYDAGQAARVSGRARDEADLEKALDCFETLYGEILTGPRRPEIASEAHMRAVAQFLHAYLPRRPGDARWPWLADKERLDKEAEALQARIADLSRHLERVEQDVRTQALARQELESRLAHLTQNTQELAERLAEAQTQLAGVTSERERLGAALADVSTQLADVKRSRLLRWGRSLRRLAGLPVPY